MVDKDTLDEQVFEEPMQSFIDESVFEAAIEQGIKDANDEASGWRYTAQWNGKMLTEAYKEINRLKTGMKIISNGVCDDWMSSVLDKLLEGASIEEDKDHHWIITEKQLQTGVDDKCRHTKVMKQMAETAYKDYMSVYKYPKFKGTTVDYRDFDLVCCSICGCPLFLEKRINLLESYELMNLISVSEAP